MSKKRRTGVSAALAVGAIVAGLVIPASSAVADPAPGSGDIVGVGSDTVQYLIDFGADGDTSGDGGYNSAGNLNRLINFDATPDANARAAYAEGSTSNSPISLNPTIVLRAGTHPVLRPNGSGAGIAALDIDSAGEINFARMSRPPKASEQATAAATTGVGTLRVVQLATDSLAMATATSTNAPALSTAQLKLIYTCTDTTWNQVGGTSSATIIPVIPQSGSGTRSTFEGDIGITDSQVGSCVRVGEENDPYSLYINSAGATQSTANPNVIAPFSGGRLNLYQTGYFNDPSKAYGTAQSALAPTVTLATTGSPTDGNPIYNDVRGLYVVFRNSDYSSATPFQPGGTKNWVNTLFASPSGTPFFKSGAGQALLTAAGVTPAYHDYGPGYSVG
jgi:ABC-type phosphate transport system substrate-binding protein